MKLSELFGTDVTTLSFEVFPPKTSSNFDTVRNATEKIALLSPDYMSVTYGAGGGTSEYSVMIAKNLLENHNVTPLAHLTCVSSDKQTVIDRLSEMKNAGVENILALRGDIPEGTELSKCRYHYASELVADIKKYGDFCVGGACYPEGHVECLHASDDINNLRLKVEAGCDFLTTQMFFDNNILYNFLYRLREAGITVPVVAGIMPVTNAKQIKRICSISGTYLPQRFKRVVDRFGDDDAAMLQAGICYDSDQIIDLYAYGIQNVHVYSMNKPYVAEKIKSNLSDIVGKSFR